MCRQAVRPVGSAAYLVAGVGRAGDTAGAGLGCPGGVRGEWKRGCPARGAGPGNARSAGRRCALGAVASGRKLYCARVCFVPEDPGVCGAGAHTFPFSQPCDLASFPCISPSRRSVSAESSASRHPPPVASAPTGGTWLGEAGRSRRGGWGTCQTVQVTLLLSVMQWGA